MKSQSMNRAHLHRWLTAAVAVPLLAFIIGFGPGWLLLVAILLLDLGGMLELSTLVLSGTSAWKRAVVSSMGLMLPLATYWKGALGLTLATVVVLFVSLLVHLFLYAKHEASLTSLGAVIFAQLYIPFLLSHLLLLFSLPSGRRWIFFVLLVIFAGDTGAYYVGHRWGKRRPIYILCNIISTSIWVFYLFTIEFWPILLITIFYGMFYAPIISFLEAFTMDVLGKEKKSYGRIRAWGSISFITMVVVLGKVIDLYSVDVILILILCGSILLAIGSTRIPAVKPQKKDRISPKARSLLTTRVVVFLFFF